MTKTMIQVILACFVASSLAACTALSSEQPKLIFVDEGCTYQGPTQIPPEFVLTWSVEKSPHPGFIVLVVTLSPGKTLSDLKTLPAEDPPPPWVNKLVYDTATQPGTFSKSVNLAEMAGYRGEPIYFACFFTDLPAAVGAAGPITIQK